MSLFGKQNLICCICGTKMYIDVNAQWHGFEQAVCSRECYYEKEKRKTRSILGKDDENGRS